MKDEIPEWVKVRAWELAQECGADGDVTVFARRPSASLIALARHVMKYETAPVDPDEDAVRDILKAWGCGNVMVSHRSMNDHDFQGAVAAYKKHKS